MTINDIVRQLRDDAKNYEKTVIVIPVEMIAVIEGRTQEKKFGHISAAKVIRYIADMLEE